MAATKTISIATGGTNQATTTAAEINNFATDFIANGVVGAITLNTGSGGTGAFAPNAQGSPNMTVRITGGAGYVTATPAGGTSQRIRFNADTFEDVTIAANASGSTRFDWIYAQIDATKLANPGVNKDDVFTYVVSRSTSSATDNGTPPTYGYNIGYVTVANSASSITNSNITDNRLQTGANALSNATVSPSKLATGAGANQVVVSGTTTSTTYTSTLTSSSAATLSATVGANGLLLVHWRAQVQNSGANNNLVSVALSGGNTAAASDNYAILTNASTLAYGLGTSHLFTGLTAGATTVTLNFRTTGGTLTVAVQEVIAIPL